MISGFKHIGTQIYNCAKSVPSAVINKVNKVDHTQHRAQMRADINDIAAQSSAFAHRLLPYSVNAETRLKLQHMPEKPSTIDEDPNTLLKTLRDNLVATFKNDLENGETRGYAVVHSHTNFLIEVLTKQVANCIEKAMLAGILTKVALETGLKLRGYTQEQIDSADIEIAIADNGSHGGDHAVCILSYDIDGEHYLVIDPWISGATYTEQQADEVYANHLVNPKESYYFDRPHKDKTFAINDNHCAAAVMRWITNRYDINLDSLQPFEKYV